jgi:hypothetical protein
MKYLIVVLSILMGGTMASSAFASTSVNVTNDVSSSTSTSSTGSNQTHIEIETNGVKKTFDSNGEDIHWQSDDGSSHVDVNNNGTSVHSTQQQQGSNDSSVSVKSDETSDVTPTPTKTQGDSDAHTQQAVKPEKTNHTSLVSWFKDFFSSFFGKNDTKNEHELHIFGFKLSY